MSELLGIVAIVAGAATANVGIGAYAYIKKYSITATTEQLRIKTTAETEQLKIKTNADIELKRIDKGILKPVVPQEKPKE